MGGMGKGEGEKSGEEETGQIIVLFASVRIVDSMSTKHRESKIVNELAPESSGKTIRFPKGRPAFHLEGNVHRTEAV